MKHLKKFNESIVDDLKDLTENYLAYLTDEEFIYDIRKAGWDELQITIHKNSKWNFNNGIQTPVQSEFEWHEVKDRVIPFLMILKKDYTINSINFKIFKRDDGTGEEYGRQMDDGWIRGSIENSLDDVDNIKNQSMNSLVICIDDPDKKVWQKPQKKSLLNGFIKKFI
jgi:hypothetical protein